MNIPYCYLIGWSNQNIWYYGVRFAKNCTPDDLWVSYFTSSKYVKKFRKQYGEPDVVTVRRTFIDENKTHKARLWEEKVLKRTNAVYDKKWLNRANAGCEFNNEGTIPAKNAITNELVGSVSITDPRVLSGELVHHSAGKTPPYTDCLYCGKSYPVSNIEDHEKHCKDNPNMVKRLCKFCNQEFTDHRNHVTHQRYCKHNPNREDRPISTCKYCEKSQDPRKLNEHELYCEDNPDKIEKPIHQCVYCGKQFILHIANKIEHEKYCEMNAYRIDRPTFECKYCSAMHNTIGTLVQHETICHHNPDRAIQQCSFCGKEITGGSGNLSQHETSCTLNENRNDNPSHCKYCSKGFITHKGMTKHEIECTSNPDRIIYQCSYCSNEIFGGQGNLVKHETCCESNINRIIPSYSCKYCLKDYSTTGRLNIHEIECTANPDRVTRNCSICNKEITGGRGNLVQHEKSCERKQQRILK